MPKNVRFKIRVGCYGTFEGQAPVVAETSTGYIVRLKTNAGPYRRGDEIRITKGEVQP